MDLFDGLTLIGGLSLFLFGMNIMGQALEKRAGEKLKQLLGRLTTEPAAGFVTGLVITAVIQSSSAATVMVVGFVNSGLMTLRGAINVIMGANIGTTVTAWLLGLAGIDSKNTVVRLFKPSSFTPMLALAGIILYMFGKNEKKKDTGTIFLGFATLMYGMEAMAGAVSGLKEVSWFGRLFILFKHPLLGVLAGAVLTAVIQSSSASVGILQALAATGQVTYGAAIPIIMGQNIGTCVTAMVSSLGANKNAKRAALVHLSFNVIGTLVWLTVFVLVGWLSAPALLDEAASLPGIALAHTVFNLLCTLLLLPFTGALEKLVIALVPQGDQPQTLTRLDERLLATPAIAMERCQEVAQEMAKGAAEALRGGMTALREYSPDLARLVREKEEKTDRDEDALGSYLVKLGSCPLSEEDNARIGKLLKLIGDIERIADHGVNLLESAEEMKKKEMAFTPDAMEELGRICGAVEEILELALRTFLENDEQAAVRVEPLEQDIDRLKEQLRTSHVLRLQQGRCSMEAGFIWVDVLTALERSAAHCTNIALCVMDAAHHK